MNARLGRNPFEAKAAKPAEKPRSEPGSAPRLERKRPSRSHRALTLLDHALSWRMERFAFFRYDRDDGGGKRRLSLVSLGLRNAAWAKKRRFELDLLRRGPVALTLLSVRIQTS